MQQNLICARSLASREQYIFACSIVYLLGILVGSFGAAWIGRSYFCYGLWVDAMNSMSRIYVARDQRRGKEIVTGI
jgi:hypothetical protein